MWPDAVPGPSAKSEPDASGPAENAESHDAASPETETGEPAALPRIVAALAPPSTVPTPERHEQWRRQFLTALKEADDNGPLPPPVRTPSTSRSPAIYAEPPDVRRAEPPSSIQRVLAVAPSRSATKRVVSRALVAAGVVMSIFSTGALWATYRSETATEAEHLKTAAIVVDAGQAALDEGHGQPMVNTPVLVREGEALTLAPAADDSLWRRPPAAPSPSPIQTSRAIEPLIINRQVAVHAVPAVPGSFEPAPPASPTMLPLDRDGMTELVARQSAEPPAPERPPHATDPSASHRVQRHTEPAPARQSPSSQAARVSHEAYQSRGPTATRGYAGPPRINWDSRRQGLRTAPPTEPEPSTLKKLLTAMWPGSSANKVQPAKPEPTPVPAAPVQRHNWADIAHPDP